MEISEIVPVLYQKNTVRNSDPIVIVDYLESWNLNAIASECFLNRI